MSLIPAAGFRLLFRGDGTLAPGEHVEGIIVLTAPEHIPRAERLDLWFESIAWAGYGAGKNRQVIQRTMFNAPMHCKLPPGGLPPGEHQYPFSLELPRDLPVNYSGADCGVIHRCNLRLDVDWAIDPTAAMSIMIAPRPFTAERRTVAVRSPPNFHDAIALDVTMASSLVVQGQPLEGTIALRTGHAAQFDAVTISLQHIARVNMGRGESRATNTGVVHVAADLLRGGAGVPFAFPATGVLPPHNVNRSLDLFACLEITLHAGIFSKLRFSIPIVVLPRGSVLTGDASPQQVGQSRLATLAAFLASRMARPTATPPALFQGQETFVSFWLQDGSRGSDYAALESFEFPALHLGLRTRAAGLFTPAAPATPAWLSGNYALAHARHPGVPTEDVLRAFLAEVLALPADIQELNLSDHRLTFRRRLQTDNAEEWLEAALPLPGRALRIARAIEALPFALQDVAMRDAWIATAREEDALLLGHSPAIVGIKRGVRTVGGEERSFTAALTTHWEAEAPSTWLDIALGDAWLSPRALEELSSDTPHELIRAARALFGDLHATTPDHLVAVRPGLQQDPRTLLPALEALIEWVLLSRGERRADAPYR